MTRQERDKEAFRDKIRAASSAYTPTWAYLRRFGGMGWAILLSMIGAEASYGRPAGSPQCQTGCVDPLAECRLTGLALATQTRTWICTRSDIPGGHSMVAGVDGGEQFLACDRAILAWRQAAAPQTSKQRRDPTVVTGQPSKVFAWRDQALEFATTKAPKEIAAIALAVQRNEDCPLLDRLSLGAWMDELTTLSRPWRWR